MTSKRSDEISIKLRHEAKQIYDSLPAKGKGEWVSEAIIEKADREQGNTLIQQIEEIRQHVKELEAELGRVKEWKE